MRQCGAHDGTFKTQSRPILRGLAVLGYVGATWAAVAAITRAPRIGKRKSQKKGVWVVCDHDHQGHDCTPPTPTIFLKFKAGGDLLSHTLPGAVPSAQVSLATGFGKGPGGSLPLTTTDTTNGTKHTHPHTWWCAVSFQTLHNRREQPTNRATRIIVYPTR